MITFWISQTVADELSLFTDRFTDDLTLLIKPFFFTDTFTDDIIFIDSYTVTGDLIVTG